MANQQQVSNTPETVRDSWQTPQWLFDFAASQLPLTVDLAASDTNYKIDNYLTIEHDSLEYDWAELTKAFGGYCWCNPPYSETGKWLRKAWAEAQRGFRGVFLVPTPNGEEYWDSVFSKASTLIFINGRISFIASADFIIKGKNGKPDRYIKKGQAVNGNTRGSCLVIFDRSFIAPTSILSVDRDSLIKGGY